MSKKKTRRQLIEISDRKVSRRVEELFNFYIECSRAFTFFGSKHDYMIWDEDCENEYHCWRSDDDDYNYDFKDYPHWTAIN